MKKTKTIFERFFSLLFFSGAIHFFVSLSLFLHTGESMLSPNVYYRKHSTAQSVLHQAAQQVRADQSATT